MPRNIVEVYSGIASGNWWLQKSQEFLPDNKMIELAAFCALKFEQKGTLLVCDCYASKNSPIDLLTGFPAETLHKEGSQWEETGESNGFTLKSKSIRTERGDKIVVETIYDFPTEYNGPQYLRRVIIFERKSMKILKVEITFKNGLIDSAEFQYQGTDNLMLDWTLHSEHLNKMNVNFF